MSRLAQDSFISDDEEEVCPLCVEEFDISDKGFKPCPCGYQVCQFCYNNIRQNPQLNGRCPGCRRPYDDESVEYRVVTAEEWRQDHQKQTRREKEKRQKERERKEIEQASRKHLSGMRVIQKNLVYVVGLNPHIPHEELHNTLRGDQFFGQYGKIQKIVVNRRNGGAGNGGIGVYVTYYRKEDAAKCIAAVDNSTNDGKILRAAYGTTKYCSSYLRNQPCPNPNCMFLHEPGEEADSYTRQDLSTIQHAARQGDSKSGLTRQTSAKTTTTSTKAADDNHAEFNESSALPPTASWAAKASPPMQNSKLTRPSQQTASPVKTPAISQVTNNAPTASEAGTTTSQSDPPTQPAKQEQVPPITFSADKVLEDRNATVQLFESALKLLSTTSSVKFSFSSQLLAKEEMMGAQSMPPLFAFSDKVQSSYQTGSSDTKATETGSRQSSRYNFLDKPKMTEHLLEQQQMMKGGSVIGLRPGATPPPPGLFGNGQREGQEILSMVSGGRSKVPLSSKEPPLLGNPYMAPSSSLQVQSQVSSIEPPSAFSINAQAPLGTSSIDKLLQPFNHADPSMDFSQWGRPATGTAADWFSSATPSFPTNNFPVLPNAAFDMPLASTTGTPPPPPGLSVNAQPSTPQPEEKNAKAEDAAASVASRSAVEDLPSAVEAEAPAHSVKQDSYADESEWKVTPLSQSSFTPVSRGSPDPTAVQENMTKLLNERLTSHAKISRSATPTTDAAESVKSERIAAASSSTTTGTPALSRMSSPAPSLSATAPSDSHPPSPSPSSSPAPVDIRSSKKERKKAKKAARKGLLTPTTVAESKEEEVVTPSSDPGPAETPAEPETHIDPLELLKTVIKELSSSDLSFFKQPISGSVTAPRMTFTKPELEEAYNKFPEYLGTDVLQGRSLEDVESEWHATRKETEVLEKKLVKLIKRNRRLAAADALKI